jgi:hypothetical protein
MKWSAGSDYGFVWFLGVNNESLHLEPAAYWRAEYDGLPPLLISRNITASPRACWIGQKASSQLYSLR